MKKNFKVVLGLVVVLFTLLSTLSTFQAFAVTSVTEAQFLDMCVRADNFMYNYGVVPLIVYTDSSQTDSVTAAEFFYMMSRWMRYYKNYSAPPTSVGITRGTGGPPSPSGIESGTIYKAELLNICKSHADFIDTNGRMANYTILSDGSHITPEAFFRVMSRTIKWFNDNGVLPNYTVVTAESAPSSWTGGGTPQPTPTPGSYPWSKSLTVAYTGQPDGYTCGPTSLRMTMGYYGTWYGVSTISDYMASIGDSPYYDGVAESTIMSAASHYGFTGRSQLSGWTALKTAIQNDKPVIAHIQIAGGSYPCYYPSGEPAYTGSYGHYLVVTGLQADGSGNVLYVIVNDPARGQYVKYTYSSFNSAWADNSYHFIQLN